MIREQCVSWFNPCSWQEAICYCCGLPDQPWSALSACQVNLLFGTPVLQYPADWKGQRVSLPASHALALEQLVGKLTQNFMLPLRCVEQTSACPFVIIMCWLLRKPTAFKMKQKSKDCSCTVNLSPKLASLNFIFLRCSSVSKPFIL